MISKNNRTAHLIGKFAKANIGGTISINDIAEKEFSGKKLSKEEKTALVNFEKFRLAELNAIHEDMEFHERYRHLQVMANLSDFHDFLKEPYCNLP